MSRGTDPEPATYAVQGMSCSHCEAAVTRAVGAIAGVESVQVDLTGGRVTVQGAGVADDAIRTAIDDAGYEASRA